MNQRADTYVASRKIALEKKLIEGGEEQRLEDYLRQKLIESGWKDDLKKYCKELIRKKGLEKVTIDELVNELVERGRNTVPNKIKEDLLARIKNYFEDEGY
ncbi:enhancer of yellow 2 transcription factor-like protein (macronuclear) [Tetrahymena thermophila SB210]|uniref:Transcription and mRNA export factor ENY2 n=1 Tax=Tetrahymena thermophila (strain SB210) TaxID=312017 RepID=W7XCD5_TETTS|nr:enhancer of yellow 2 transcription factor-like protein [Tetrahymena thermophila SB210]EWS75097.1 enhancer of yellow 2 transcription factor-like protein [Tetrahymena thermophila SB210]|eukprot:XP_012652335.1 enhancer of yellow 2 transcription factor-like protein [Tetrahymena thermophila SB210]